MSWGGSHDHRVRGHHHHSRYGHDGRGSGGATARGPGFYGPPPARGARASSGQRQTGEARYHLSDPPDHFANGRGGTHVNYYDYQNQQYEQHGPRRDGYAHRDPGSFQNAKASMRGAQQRDPADTEAYWHSAVYHRDGTVSAGESLLSFKRAVRRMTTDPAKSVTSESGAYSLSDARCQHGTDERIRGTEECSCLNFEELDHCEDDGRSISSSRLAGDLHGITNKAHSGSRSNEGAILKRPLGAQTATLSPTSMISVFWDIENCAVPSGVPAYDIVRKVRQNFYAGHREADFIVACDISRMNSAVVAELNEALVTVIHVPGDQKNAADEKLRHVLRRFSDAHKLTNSRIVLISGDVDFAAEIHQMRYRDLIHVVLIHNDQAKRALRDAANESISYTDFVAQLRQSGTKTAKAPNARDRPVGIKEMPFGFGKECASGNKDMQQQTKKKSLSKFLSSIDGSEAEPESTVQLNKTRGPVTSTQASLCTKVGLLVPKEPLNKEFWNRYLSNFNISQHFDIEVGTSGKDVVSLLYPSAEQAKAAVAALSEPLLDEDDSPVCLGILSNDGIGDSTAKPEASNLATKVKAAVSTHKERLAAVRKKVCSVQSDNSAGVKQKKALGKLAAVYEAQLNEFMKTVSDHSREYHEGEDWATVEIARLRRASLVYSVKSRILDNFNKEKIVFLVTTAGSRRAVEIASYLQDVGKRVLSIQPSDLEAEQCAKSAGSVSGMGPVQCWLQPNTLVKPESEVVFTSARHFVHEFVRREHSLYDFQAIVVDGLQEDSVYQRVVLTMLRKHFVSNVGVVLCSNKSDVCFSIQEAFGLGTHDIVKCDVKFPVEVVWKGKPTNRINSCVSAALEFVLNAKASGGDVLVFLPSLADAFRADALLDHKLNGKDMEVLISHEVLFGCMGSTFSNGQPMEGFWRIIFAAECPDTFAGMMHVRCVIDSGLTLRTVYRSGAVIKQLAYVSEVEAEERRALAGIHDHGTCYRMYSREACVSSPPVDVSESRFLEDIILRLSALRANSSDSYLGSFPKKIIKEVKCALQKIGMLDHDGRLTELGEKLCKTSLEPRLGKLVLGSMGRAPSLDAILVSILAFEDLLAVYRQLKKDGTERSIPVSDAESVFARVIELYKNWVIVPKKMKSTWCELNGVNEAFITRLHITAQAIQAEFDTFRGRNLCADSLKQEKDAKLTLGQLLVESFPHAVLQPSQKGYKHPTLGNNLHISDLSLFDTHTEQAKNVVCSLFAQVHNEKKLQLLNFSNLPDSTSKHVSPTSTCSEKDTAPNLEERFGPVGKLIWNRQFSSLQALQGIQGKLRFAADGAQCSLSLDSTNQCVLIKGHEKYCLEARQYLQGIVSDQVTKLCKKDREAFLTPQNSPYSTHPVSAVLGIGGRIDEVLSPASFRTLIVREIRIPLPEFGRRVNELGDVVQYWLLYKDNAFQVTYKTAKEADAAYRVLNAQRDELRVFVQGHAYEYRKEQRQRRPAFHAQLSLPRRRCVGIGFAQLADQASFDRIATKLPLRANLNGSTVTFMRDKKVSGQLYIQGLPPTADQSSVENLIRGSLSVEPKTVCLVHERARITTQARLQAIEDAIQKTFDEALDTRAPKLVFKSPRDTDYTENGWMSFEDAVVAQSVCTLLKGAPIAIESDTVGGSTPLQLTIDVLLEETLYFPLAFFRAIQGRLEEELRRQEGLRPEDNLKCDATPCGTAVCVKLKANNLNDFQKVMHLFNSLLIGPDVPRVDARLRHERVREVIKAAAPGGGIYVYSKPDGNRLVGDTELISAASEMLKKHVKAWDKRKRKTLQLVGEGLSSLRSFVAAFGDDTWYLTKECKLDSAKFDGRFGLVEIVGTDTAVAKAEELVSQLPRRRVQAEATQTENRCPICLEPQRPPGKKEAPMLGHRLELCGHWHCESCLILAFKRATLPLSCYEKDCASPWAIADIAHVTNNDAELLSELARRSVEWTAAAEDADGRWLPCPTPECHFTLNAKAKVGDQGVRVLGDVHICPGCTNAVCFQCRSLYHYGMSCAAFRASMAPKDSSDKSWLKGDPGTLAVCPACAASLDQSATSGGKVGACWSCRRLFCWRCHRGFQDDAAAARAHRTQECHDASRRGDYTGYLM